VLTDRESTAGETAGSHAAGHRPAQGCPGRELGDCAFPNLGFETSISRPGEIALLTAEGYETRCRRSGMQICAFLWVYYGTPPRIRGHQCRATRATMRRALCPRDDIDIDTWPAFRTRASARHGYATTRHVPYRVRSLSTRPPGPQFHAQNQQMRDLVAP